MFKKLDAIVIDPEFTSIYTYIDMLRKLIDAVVSAFERLAAIFGDLF